MALTKHHIKQGDLLPILAATLQTAAGVVVDLTGGTIKFLMRTEPGATPKINAAAAIVSPTAGTVQYLWSGTDTDTAGIFQGEFEFTAPGGKKYTFPNDSYFQVVITDDVG
jgi:hypothetical protein